MRSLAVCCALTAFLYYTAPLTAGDGPADGIPELKVLEYYRGDWDVAITSKDSGFTKGESTAKWILDGRFLEQSGYLISTDGTTRTQITTLMTFDTKKRVYRSWVFVSNGTTNESEGTWDAASKTLTSVTLPDENGVRSSTTADFSTPGKESWKIVSKDKSGEVVGELHGENTRRKK